MKPNRKSGHDNDNNDIDTIDNLEDDNRTEEFNIDQTATGNTNTGNIGIVEDKDSMKIHLQVLDLTPYEFNNNTNYLLMKDLSFTPTPPSKEANLREDFAEFTRKLRLKEYFIDKNYQFEDIVRPKSEFTPQSGRVPELDDIASEIETTKIKEKKFKDNLSKSERKALNELRHNNEIVIKQADIGGNCCHYDEEILPRNGYGTFVGSFDLYRSQRRGS